MKRTRARTHVSVSCGYEGSFFLCIGSRINISNSHLGQREPSSGLIMGKCRVNFW